MSNTLKQRLEDFSKTKMPRTSGQYTIAVEGKEMDSNPTGSGIYITSSSDYLLDVSADLSQSTIYGIMSMKSGDKLNMKSNLAMEIKSEHSISESATTGPDEDRPGTISTFADTSWTSITGTTWDHISTGIATIVGSEIQLNPDD